MKSLYIYILYIHNAILYLFFFFNDTATTEIYTLSLHDALPICCHFRRGTLPATGRSPASRQPTCEQFEMGSLGARSEEHTSELQSRQYLVCRLLLEKKKN